MRRKQWIVLGCMLPAIIQPTSSGLAQDSTDALRSTDWRFSRSRQATSAIDRRLAPALDGLRRASREPVRVLTGAGAQSVVSLDLDIPSPLSSSFERTGQSFLTARLPAITHSVLPTELKPKTMPYACETAPEPKGKTGRTQFFDRVIDGKPVVGGLISVRMNGDGTVTSVFNSLAAVPSKPLQWDDVKSLRDIPALNAARRAPIAKIIPDAKQRAAALKLAQPVWIPLRAAHQQGLLGARHATWSNAQGELMNGFVLPDDTVLAPSLVPGTRKDRKIPVALIDERTKLPTFVSYRSRGGYPVAAAGIFDNPAEVAFRYLEENPEVFLTGQARCQFDVVDIGQSSISPRITYVKLEQVIAGRRVYGAQLVFEIEDGARVQTIQGHTIGHADMPLVPQIDYEQARSTALAMIDTALPSQPASVRNDLKKRATSVDLVIFPGEVVAQKGLAKPLQSRLAYHARTLLHGLFVDAVTGNVLYGYSRLHGANVVRDAGGATILQEPTFREVSRDGVISTPGTALSPDAAAANAALPIVRDFYLAHGWRGTDGTGSDLVANVNVNMFTCPNAFSPPAPPAPGNDQSYFCVGEAVGDVLPHELTHGVVWNSSNLTYADESGALNESYADIMGNLAFPDVVVPPATIPTWISGEGTTAFAAGIFRNMANPTASAPPQPANYGTYLARNDLGCSPVDIPGIACDFGGVHLNSGIPNLAHVLMSDGGAGGLVGMGRPKVRTLAFDVMTARLSSWSRMIDAAIATKVSCDTAFALGARDVTGAAAFTQLDCDQVPGAFGTVGLDPDLVSNWIPPAAGFAGILVRFAGETTDNGCTITDLALQMNSPSGLIESRASIAGATSPLVVNYLGLLTSTIATSTPPIGTTTKRHVISWTSAFGEMPVITSSIVALPPAGATNCLGFAVTETRDSAVTISPGIPFVGGAGLTATGNAGSVMNTQCTLTGTDVQLVDDSGNTISDAGPTAAWSDIVWNFGVTITLARTVAIAIAPPGATPAGPTNFNLSGTVSWTYTPGLGDARWKLVYRVGKPAGVTCSP